MKSFISALFLVLTVTVAFSQNPTPESYVDKGKEALKANNLKEAEANFQKRKGKVNENATAVPVISVYWYVIRANDTRDGGNIPWVLIFCSDF